MFSRYLILSVLFILLLVPFGHIKADPLPFGSSDLYVGKDAADGSSLNKTNTVTVKKKHGYLEYDGTGYRLVSRTIKPEKAGYVRLKPVAASKDVKGKPTFYTIEVAEEKNKALNDREKAAAEEPAEEKPHFALERADDIDKKGVGMMPTKSHKADVGLGLKVSESTELLMGRALVLERKDDNRNMDARDDGWRFRFKTNF